MSNSTKVWFFLLALSMTILTLGYQLGDRQGLFIAFLISLAIHCLIYFYGDIHLIKKLNGRKVLGQDPWGVQKIIHHYADKAGIIAPQFYVIEISTMTAFSVGRTHKTSSIVLTQGLIEKLTTAELESVIAHEIAHIKKLDTFAFGVSSTLANTLMGFGIFLDRFAPQKKIFTSLISPFAWIFIRSTVSSQNYFKNDAEALESIEDPKTLAWALWKIHHSNQFNPMRLPPCSSHLFILNPQNQEDRHWLLNMHPQIEKRIQKIVGYYPL